MESRDQMPPAEESPAGHRALLRATVRAGRKAVLATSLDGHPYGSLVTIAFDHDLSPILLLSQLADHTRNLAVDDRASVLLDGTLGHANPQTGPRVTLMGRLAKDDTPRLRARFLAVHPLAALYAGFGDFAIWRMTVERAHFVGGFARAQWFDMPLVREADAVAAAEADILAEINADAESLAQLGGEAGWTVVAVDPDGCDLARGDAVRRVAFGRAADSAGAALALLRSANGQPPLESTPGD
jgi:putative heme iron utilization protein